MGIKMKDRHLNIFYTYNHALIENNMTRSLIITLRTLSPVLRRIILSRLFKPNFKFKQIPNFEQTEFALQEKVPIRVEKIRKIPHKYLVVLTGDGIIENLEKYKDIKNLSKVKTSSLIKPDAWIFDDQKIPQFCFLIECKTIGDPLDAKQIIAYAKYFYAIQNYREFEKILIQITWYDILDICTDLLEENLFTNQQEKSLLLDLIEYLSFCHVIQFTGFNFIDISEFPDYEFSEYLDFNFSEISKLPSYEIATFIDLGLKKIPDMPNYFINRLRK